MEPIGVRIKHKLDEKGWSLKMLSNKTNISYTGLREAVARDDFKISMLVDISDALGVEIAYWFTGEEGQPAKYDDIKALKKEIESLSKLCDEREQYISDLRKLLNLETERKKGVGSV